MKAVDEEGRVERGSTASPLLPQRHRDQLLVEWIATAIDYPSVRRAWRDQPGGD